MPGVAEYFASHSVLARRNSLVKQLEAEGLAVNRPALLLSAGTDVPHQYLINALEAALSIMRGDERRACSYSHDSGDFSRTKHWSLCTPPRAIERC